MKLSEDTKSFIRFKHVLLLWSIMLLAPSLTWAQLDYNKIQTIDSNYLEYIYSVECSPLQSKQQIPIIELGSSQKIQVEFDDLYGDYMEYQYTLIHCDKDWNMDLDMERSKYIEGREFLDIEQYDGSVSTNIAYYHYQFTFPNADIEFIWSGNYILVVFDQDGYIAFTRRIYVLDKSLQIEIFKEKSIGMGEYATHQAFKVALNPQGLRTINPINELYVTAFQNYMNERTVKNIQADFAQGSKLKFSNQKQFSFPGLKEYRFFDIRGVEQARANISAIQLNKDDVRVVLDIEKDRNLKSNFSTNELNGAYFIDNFDRKSLSPRYTAEYCKVMFNLKTAFPTDNPVYILGEFNNWKPDHKYKMQYLEEHRAYMGEVILKQGYYNYLFGVQKPDGSIDYITYEGSSHETENDYHILVYFRSQQFEYDQLVSYAKFNYRQF